VPGLSDRNATSKPATAVMPVLANGKPILARWMLFILWISPRRTRDSSCRQYPGSYYGTEYSPARRDAADYLQQIRVGIVSCLRQFALAGEICPPRAIPDKIVILP